jgi:hypothetical protein
MSAHRYQWARGGVPIAGATAATYTLTASTADISVGPFSISCTVLNGLATVSAAAVVTVTLPPSTIPPSFVVDAADVVVPVGATATFTVSTLGDNLSLQWYKDAVAILGATGASYSLAASLALNGAQFSCVISNSLGTASSRSAFLALSPSITGQSGAQSVNVGSTATFSVTATGPALTFSWRQNGVAIANAPSSPSYSYVTLASDVGLVISVQCLVSGGPNTASPTLTALARQQLAC